jgi:hypothetical protein
VLVDDLIAAVEDCQKSPGRLRDGAVQERAAPTRAAGTEQPVTSGVGPRLSLDGRRDGAREFVAVFFEDDDEFQFAPVLYRQREERLVERRRARACRDADDRAQSLVVAQSLCPFRVTT